MFKTAPVSIAGAAIEPIMADLDLFTPTVRQRTLKD
jgi:hypothetical protein